MKENHIHHLSSQFNEAEYQQEIELLYQEDLSVFENSVFYVAVDESEIIGSVKVTRWNKRVVLPMEKLFSLKIDTIPEATIYHQLWHVGRFAIRKDNGIQLLKKLLFMAISVICESHDSLMLAECDNKFVKVLNLMGIKTKAIASSIFYLGSETLPIISTYDWLNKFLEHMTKSETFSINMAELLENVA